jgi:hypothetical protein
MTKESVEQFEDLKKQIEKYDKQIDEIELRGIFDIPNMVRLFIALDRKVTAFYKQQELIYQVLSGEDKSKIVRPG